MERTEISLKNGEAIRVIVPGGHVDITTGLDGGGGNRISRVEVAEGFPHGWTDAEGYSWELFRINVVPGTMDLIGCKEFPLREFRVRAAGELWIVRAASVDQAIASVRAQCPLGTVVRGTENERATLPVGTLVKVYPFPIRKQNPYQAVVRGYDMHRSKYELGQEYLPGKYSDGGSWAFSSEVNPVTENGNEE